MIGVSEESKLQTVQTELELQELLAGYVGRLIRVRTISETKKGDSYRGTPYYIDLNYEDEIGELRTLKLERVQRYRGHSIGDRTPTSSYATLRIELKGFPQTALNFDSSTVDVLQADSGNWKTIHRGKDWLEASERFEEKEKNR